MADDGSSSSLPSLQNAASGSTQDATTSLAVNRNVGKLLDSLGSSSNAVVAAVMAIASAIVSSIIGGTTGSTANTLLRAKGTGGRALQPSVVTIDNSGNIAGANSLSLPLTPYAVVCAGTTNPGALETTASAGSSGQILVSRGPAALPAYVTLIDGIGGLISFPQNQTYWIWLSSPFAFTVSAFGTICSSGSCTATLATDGGVNIVSNSVSTSFVQNTASTPVPASGNLFIIITSNSACQFLTFIIDYTRLL